MAGDTKKKRKKATLVEKTRNRTLDQALADSAADMVNEYGCSYFDIRSPPPPPNVSCAHNPPVPLASSLRAGPCVWCRLILRAPYRGRVRRLGTRARALAHLIRVLVHLIRVLVHHRAYIVCVCVDRQWARNQQTKK